MNIQANTFTEHAWTCDRGTPCSLSMSCHHLQLLPLIEGKADFPESIRPDPGGEGGFQGFRNPSPAKVMYLLMAFFFTVDRPRFIHGQIRWEKPPSPFPPPYMNMCYFNARRGRIFKLKLLKFVFFRETSPPPWAPQQGRCPLYPHWGGRGPQPPLYNLEPLPSEVLDPGLDKYYLSCPRTGCFTHTCLTN